MPYSIFEHRHRFSAWAAARAAQVRSGVKVRDFREALEKSGLTEFLKEPASKHVTQDEFEVLHRRWCSAIIDYLGTKGMRNIAYGRAAKLVAVYLKAMVVLGTDPDCELAQIAHPPRGFNHAGQSR
jgi:hypothetical protein